MSDVARWTHATALADTWVDPDDDPRASGDVSPDGELPTLLDHLTNHRLTPSTTCEGLDVRGPVTARTLDRPTSDVADTAPRRDARPEDVRGWRRC